MVNQRHFWIYIEVSSFVHESTFCGNCTMHLLKTNIHHEYLLLSLYSCILDMNILFHVSQEICIFFFFFFFFKKKPNSLLMTGAQISVLHWVHWACWWWTEIWPGVHQSCSLPPLLFIRVVCIDVKFYVFFTMPILTRLFFKLGLKELTFSLYY